MRRCVATASTPTRTPCVTRRALHSGIAAGEFANRRPTSPDGSRHPLVASPTEPGTAHLVIPRLH